ncbi:MAG: cytidylate kinase family protein [Bacteroidaceae bacterium]|nr:cytidylate kinase family protein [Bacteroidaceae bacterium]
MSNVSKTKVFIEGKTPKRSAKELLRRYFCFIIALFIIAFGTSLSIRANLGSSPISCPPYVLCLAPGTPYSMGVYVICMHIFFILSQILLLRRNYQVIQLLQIVVSFLFGFYTDITMWMTSYLQILSNTPLAYMARFGELLLGGGLLAYGISAEVHCDVLMLAGEGFPLAISKVVHKDFGKVKMCSDTGLVLVGVIFMFLIFGKWQWDMIGFGTLFSMFYVGFMVRRFSPHLCWLESFFTIRTPQKMPLESISRSSVPFVITISREYGSGGHIVGEKLSEALHIPLYDRELIDHTAEELGYSPDFVAANEQNISTSKLWELIFTDKSIPDSMNPSKDDAIFVSQSRTIMNLATIQPCIIIGRCANWILRNSINSLRVFICSDLDFATHHVMIKDHLSETAARHKIETVNKARANHYYQYTGGNWTDSRNYDLVVNTSKLGTEGAVKLIQYYLHKASS